MKPILAYVWQRRWCRLLVALTILCALPLLNSFVRQSIFGPTIDGIPWCEWEDYLRRSVHPDRSSPSWFERTLDKILPTKRMGGAVNLDTLAALPLYLHLAEDSDVKVRQEALGRMVHGYTYREHQSEIMPTYRRHLQDADPYCRLCAAEGIWNETKDREMIAVVLLLTDQAQASVHMSAGCLLAEMAGADPDLFEPLSKLAEDADLYVRIAAVSSMKHFGKRGVPVLRQALQDSAPYVRFCAITAASKLGQDALELTPLLRPFQKDPNPHVGRSAAHALYMIDPKQFPKPATWVD
jgi:hypothetical protein